MDCFIKKIFDGKIDEYVHLQFQKFSRGEFKDKALVKASRSKKGFSISTTYEYANEFVRSVAEKLGNNKTGVYGVIVSAKNLKEIPEFNHLLAHVEVKQFMGIKQFKIEQEMSGNEIWSILDMVPSAFLGLSFSANGTYLKIKPKAPKSAKPSTKGGQAPTPDFCKIKTNDIEIVKGILFDVPEGFKKAEISHDFIIKEIILPQGEKEPEKMRRLAKRKGEIVRKLNIDEKEIVKRKEFVA
jgi:hypothetical protein